MNTPNPPQAPNVDQMYQVALVQALDLVLQFQAIARAAVVDVIDTEASEEQGAVVLKSAFADSSKHEALASVSESYYNAAEALNAIRMPAPNIHLSRPSIPPVKLPNGPKFDGPPSPFSPH
jgi:hypothetical protein